MLEEGSSWFQLTQPVTHSELLKWIGWSCLATAPGLEQSPGRKQGPPNNVFFLVLTTRAMSSSWDAWTLLFGY